MMANNYNNFVSKFVILLIIALNQTNKLVWIVEKEACV